MVAVTEFRLPKPLLVAEVVGIVCLALGAANLWASIESFPAGFRFEGYGILLVALGATMILPALAYSVRLALLRGREQSSPLVADAGAARIDKGFCLSYDKLSNRRKFRRTILFASLFIPAGAYLLWVILGEMRIVLVPLFVVLCSILAVVQMMATCHAWKAESGQGRS